MKVRASLKSLKEQPGAQVVRRRGRVYVIRPRLRGTGIRRDPLRRRERRGGGLRLRRRGAPRALHASHRGRCRTGAGPAFYERHGFVVDHVDVIDPHAPERDVVWWARDLAA